VNEGDEEDWKDGVVEVKRVKASEAGLRDIVLASLVVRLLELRLG